MIIIGLTGSIAMGKSETAKMFQQLGIPAYSADAAVHQLYARGGAAVKPIRDIFPDVIVNGAVCREKLSQKILADRQIVSKIEKIVHPLVREKRNEFISQSRQQDAAIIVLDIPLLFETGSEDEVDKIVVVTAPAHIQKQRALERPEMTPEKFTLILSRQMPDEEKRAKADYVVETDKGLEHAFHQVEALLKDLTAGKS